MGFFKNLFGLFGHSNDDEQDYLNDDSQNDNYGDGGDFPYFSIAKVGVQGIEDLDEDEQNFIKNGLKEDMRVYLRYEFDNPKDYHAIQVLYHSHLIGYIDKEKASVVQSYLMKGNIGAVVVSKKEYQDFKTIVELKIFYADSNGKEVLPDNPIEGRQISVIETEIWTGQEDWSEDWSRSFYTDELLYKYRELYDDAVDEEEQKTVDWEVSLWIQSYLEGRCVTRKGCEGKANQLWTECARKVYMKRVESYLEHKGYHFAEKELYEDSKVVERYAPDYELDYIDGQGHHQRKTIECGAEMNSCVVGYSDYYARQLATLEENEFWQLQIMPEPDNEFDSDALAVYDDEEHVGYIPKEDIPAVALIMGNNCAEAYVDKHASLRIPVTFHKIECMSDEELSGFRFYKTERIQYETVGYQELISLITKDEFIEGIKEQS